MYKRVLAVISLFIISTVSILAQFEPVEVVRSDDKVVIEKKVYYIHIVKQGQTLYSISRAYNVPQKDILLENPNIYIGLQTGQALKIPFVAESRKEDVAQDADGDFILHTIEPGQTLFFLSRAYDVEMDEIIRLNPGAEEGLKISQVVKIPARPVYVSREGFPAEDDDFIYHRVEQGETLYSLSRKYDIPVKALTLSNEKLIWGLRYGEYLKIPKYYDQEGGPITGEQPVAALAPPEPDAAGIYDLEAVIDAECLEFNYHDFGRPFNVALMLPLFIEKNYPVEIAGITDPEQARKLHPDHVWEMDKIYHETLPFLEFYEGALMAVDSLVKAGLSVTLNVYDTERNPGKVREIIQSAGFRNTDLIIGPVYPENMKIVADWAQRNRVNIVSPLTSRSEFLAGNPYLFQVTPSTSVELAQASAFISNFPSSNFILVHKNDPYERNLVDAFKGNIFRHFSYSSDFDNLVFKEVLLTGPTVRIDQSLVEGGKNIVIIPSTDQAFVSDVIMRLNILSRKFDITIFGLNDWQRFANLEVEYLHNMELHFASPFFIDYERENVKAFLRSFRNIYKTEPSHYGFQGYDIMFYFLQALKKFGPDFHQCLPMIRTDLLQADFLFRKSDYRDGFENNGVSIVKYDKDMSIKRLGLNAQTR
jgi:LysM repeat protein